MARTAPRRGLVVLTRAVADSAALRSRLEAAGFDVEEVPTTEIVWQAPPADWGHWAQSPADTTSATTTPADALALTSRHGAAGWDRWRRAARLIGPPLVGCVGAATAAAAEALGMAVDVVAQEPATATSLADALRERLRPAHDRVLAGKATVVLWPRGRDARPDLKDALTAWGCTVEELIVYANALPAAPLPALVERCLLADAVLVAAPSACARLLGWAPQLADRPFVAIGPTTAAALRDHHGIEPVAVAASPTDEACLAAVLAATAVPRTTLFH